MKKLFLFLLFSLITLLQIQALSYLPKNAYLRIYDNDKAVKILQEILNSDPETLVAETGPGSPGQENWFFGRKTEEAVEKFQYKYGLEVTGKIDLKTWKLMNSYVENYNNPQPISKSKSPEKSDRYKAADEERKKINAQNKKDFEDAKKQAKEKDTELRDLFNGKDSSQLPTDNLQDIIDRSKAEQALKKKNQEEDKKNPPGSVNPPNDPYSQQPIQQQPQSPQTGGTSPSSPPPSGSTPQTQQPSPPATPGSENSGGQISGRPGKIGQCKATTFAHATMRGGCVADRADQQNNQRSASGVILSRSGVPAIPAVASWAGSFRDAVEIKHIATGKCKAFPVLDRGPGKGPLSKGVCIDLTGSAVDILLGNQPCKNVSGLGTIGFSLGQVQYAFIPGEKIQPGQTKECTHLVKRN